MQTTICRSAESSALEHHAQAGAPRRELTVVALVAAATLMTVNVGMAQDPADLGPELEEVRAKSGLPALVGTIFSSDRVLAAGVAGERAEGSGVPATITDLWHIGSITKSFTSTLAGKLVEADKLEWKQQLGDVLPLAADSAYASTPFADLLSHLSGLPANLTPAETIKLVNGEQSVREQRRQAVQLLMASTPKPGFEYSNAGYITAGVALEHLSDASWEELLRAHVLSPLELESAGFGPPGKQAGDGQSATELPIDQPRGHRRANGKNTAVQPGPWADNPPLLGPAGTLHMSIADLTRYAQEHLRGELGTSQLLEPETLRLIHTPRGEDGGYGLGWVVQDQDWAGGKTIWHNGSNTMWYALVVLIPDRDRGIALITNVMEREPIHAALGELMGPWWPAATDAAP